MDTSEPPPVPGAGREKPRAAPGEACELCAEPLGDGHQGAAGGRYRAVPDRYLFDAGFRLGDGAWEALQIPVRVAFFFHNSDLGRVAALYPSPAGATESLLPLEALAEVVAANPVMTDLGLVRMPWKGFDGGQEAWEAIDGFFDAVRERSRVP